MQPNPPSALKTLCLILALFLFQIPPIFAQDIPEENLVVDFTNCMSGCMDFESRLGCEVLCGCTIERFKAAYNQESYAVLFDQLDQDELSPENRAFLDETTRICIAEMDDILKQFGLEPATGPETLPPPEEDEGEG